jgi:radical SAM superfamily enzyme YgiQ (UPF0313 family)
MKKVLLNWLPPAQIDTPSPALSVLKSYLEHNNFIVDIKYWSFIIHDLMSKYEGAAKEIIDLLPFLATIAIDNSDKKCIEKLKILLQSQKPSFKVLSNNHFDEFLFSLRKNVIEIIECELEKILEQDYFLLGFSARYAQWIPARIIADIIKRKRPEIKVVIGALGNKEEAIAILEENPLFDFAAWGEGEISLLELSEKLINGQEDFNNVPGLAYRKGNNIMISENNYKKFADLNNLPYPNYDDYFEQLKHFNFKVESLLPIEGSRGCHWQKCKFCFLNEGYRYRLKDEKSIMIEIENLYKKYNVSKFVFLDNDINGKDLQKFQNLINELSHFKANECPNFEIHLAEIIPLSINAEIIKKMARAGFKAIQIGYEATSDSLLKKMNKKGRFASNLLCVKWAINYGIIISGANIMTGIIDESDEDIFDSIDNLHYLRFLLFNKGYIDHDLNPLSISVSSRYYEMVNNKELYNWDVNAIANLLPEGFSNPEKRFITFSFCKNTKNELWLYFDKINRHYKEQKYSYRLYQVDNNINYEEYYNQELVNSITFTEPVYWEVLKLANHQVISKDYLQINLENKGFTMDKEELAEVIKNLKDSYLLYSNSDSTELVSVINTDALI